MLSQVIKHLLKWSAHPLPLAGRIMISNQVILSSIWYFVSCTDYTGKTLKTAKATVRKYIWSGKRESYARAKVKWDIAVRGGIKILDPQWQYLALLVKQLLRGLSSGYELWKILVRCRVSQTKQSRRGRWLSHSNWIMNARNLVKQGSSLWQGIMKAWHMIQSGVEQHDPTYWAEIICQPLFGNMYLINNLGIQWGTDARSTMLRWMERGMQCLNDMATPDGRGWLPFAQNPKLHQNRITGAIYNKILRSIPWENNPPNNITLGQWVAPKERDGSIQRVLHIICGDPLAATLYLKDATERLKPAAQQDLCFGEELGEVRVICCIGDKNTKLDFNPRTTTEEQSLWLWGGEWIKHLEWDPREWQWRQIGILSETNILNYSTKRGYRIALRQNNHQMQVDAEVEAAGYTSKARAKNINCIWHPYLPRKVLAMHWFILTEGLPVGAWREGIGMSNQCQLCPSHHRETLHHAFQDCLEIGRTWELFCAVRHYAGLPSSYVTWKDISRGLMTEPAGPKIDEDLRWDTASAITVNMHTPWDVLRAQLLWSIWCRRVELAFQDDQFHLGAVLWHAWRNTVYCAMEAYREISRKVRNEEKRQEMFSCFQQVWIHASIFGRLQNGDIKWNIIPHVVFLPADLAAWNTTPINIQRPSPSPDSKVEFTAHPDFSRLVDELLQDAANTWQPPDPASPPHRNHEPHEQEGPSLYTPEVVLEDYLGKNLHAAHAQPVSPPASQDALLHPRIMRTTPMIESENPPLIPQDKRGANKRRRRTRTPLRH